MFGHWVGKSPRGGHSNPLQYSCLENSCGQRSLQGYSPQGCKELDTAEQLSTQHTHLRICSSLNHDFHDFTSLFLTPPRKLCLLKPPILLLPKKYAKMQMKALFSLQLFLFGKVWLFFMLMRWCYLCLRIMELALFFKHLFNFFFFLATPLSLQNLSSLTRNWTCTPLQWKHRVPITGPPENSLAFLFLNELITLKMASLAFSFK